MTIIIHNSDRLMIDYFMTKSDTGVYSATYDLTEQTIYTLMMIVHLAAFPLAVKAMEEKGDASSFEEVKKNTSLIFFLLVFLRSLVSFCYQRISFSFCLERISEPPPCC